MSADSVPACRTCPSWNRDAKPSARDTPEHPEDRPCRMIAQPGLRGRAEMRGRGRTIWTAPDARCDLWLPARGGSDV